MNDVLIVGAGTAGTETAAALRSNGYQGGITLVDQDSDLPYHRPPLSKQVDHAHPDAEPMPLRAMSFYERAAIDLILGTEVVSLDPSEGSVTLKDGRSLRGDHIVLALGSTPVRPQIPGLATVPHELLGSLSDARRLRRMLAQARDLVILGTGFLGMELATAAADRMRVTVIGSAARSMPRSVSASIALRCEAAATRVGVTLRLGSPVASVECDANGRIHAALAGGAIVSGDALVVATGSRPRTSLAERAGLAVADGILVDQFLRASHPNVSAIGDCARIIEGESTTRLTSIPSATDQARYLARQLTGLGREPYEGRPWYWSDQGELKLQIAGHAIPSDEAIVLPGRDRVTFRFRDDRLVAVETIDEPLIHLTARKLLGTGADVSVEDLSRAGGDLASVRSTHRLG